MRAPTTAPAPHAWATWLLAELEDLGVARLEQLLGRRDQQRRTAGGEDLGQAPVLDVPPECAGIGLHGSVRSDNPTRRCASSDSIGPGLLTPPPDSAALTHDG